MTPPPMASRSAGSTKDRTPIRASGALYDTIETHDRTDGQGSGMHNKFIIGDAEYTESAFVLTGSTNLTTGNLVEDLNNVIVFEDQSLARAYTMEFHEMWGSEGPTPDAENAKFGPDKTWNTPVDFLIGGSPGGTVLLSFRRHHQRHPSRDRGRRQRIRVCRARLHPG